jgi:ABC-type nitrate/sulfonate/bicarbonate transport system substrate-binding protein
MSRHSLIFPSVYFMAVPSIRPSLPLLLGLCALTLVACSTSKAEQQSGDRNALELSELRHEPYAGIVGFPELAEELGYLSPLKLKYMGSTISGPHSIQSVVTGDTDFGGAFNGAIIKLVAAKAPVQAVIGYYGADAETFSGFYVLEDSPVKSARDLIGKKVGVNTLGAHSEFMWKEYLSRSGLTPEEIATTTLVVVPPSNAEQALRLKQLDAVSLGQVFRHKAIERGGLRLLFSDYSVFGEFTAGSLIMTKRFLAENPNAARHFVRATAEAIEWARKSPREEVIAHFQKIIKARGTQADVDAQKYWRSTTVASKGGVLSDKDFQVWIDWMVKDKQIAPGQIKARDLYTSALH